VWGVGDDIDVLGREDGKGVADGVREGELDAVVAEPPKSYVLGGFLGRQRNWLIMVEFVHAQI